MLFVNLILLLWNRYVSDYESLEELVNNIEPEWGQINTCTDGNAQPGSIIDINDSTAVNLQSSLHTSNDGLRPGVVISPSKQRGDEFKAEFNSIFFQFSQAGNIHDDDDDDDDDD